jgi:hypothetical protein
MAVNKVYQVTVDSEDAQEGEWIRNLIVIAPDEETAAYDAGREVTGWGETVKGTETYVLGTERERVVGLLVDDES